jgi:hypothetical protein
MTCLIIIINNYNIIMSRIRAFAWLKIIGSGFDDLVYWHFFTITRTFNYNSSHIELLNNICLTNLYEESLINLGLVSINLKFTNELPFITAREPNSDHPRAPLLLFINALSRKPCVNSEATVWFLFTTLSFRIYENCFVVTGMHLLLFVAAETGAT